MKRFILHTTLCFTTLLLACAGPAPEPEPGMEVIQHGRNEEMQVTRGVDWNSYTKIILQKAPVKFRKNWKPDQERLIGTKIRDKDIERIETTISRQLATEMVRTLTSAGYEITGETGAGVMRFSPLITELDIQALGWVQSTIVESIVNTRGSMRIEMVIHDSVSGELLGVAWQDETDPRAGDMDMTTSWSNTIAFRLMSKHWSDWLLTQLDKARSATP